MDENAEVRRDGGSPPRAPRWVKGSAVALGVLVLLLVVVQLTGLGGQHGPGRHLPGGDTPPTSVTQLPHPTSGDAGGHTPPADGHG